MIRVLVVDDQVLIRNAVRTLIDADPGLECVGEAADGATALTLSTRLQPDVVVMDLRMPNLDGVAATRAFCADEKLSDIRILILTTFEDDANLFAALRAGANGFIGKGSEPEEITRAIYEIHAGNALLSPRATQALIARYISVAHERRPPIDNPRLNNLTEREREILGHVARGLSNDAIASLLVISPHTAKTHVNRIMSKVGTHDRSQLVVFAYENGLTAPPA